jgi:hypothetical protein
MPKKNPGNQITNKLPFHSFTILYIYIYIYIYERERERERAREHFHAVSFFVASDQWMESFIPRRRLEWMKRITTRVKWEKILPIILFISLFNVIFPRRKCILGQSRCSTGTRWGIGTGTQYRMSATQRVHL